MPFEIRMLNTHDPCLGKKGTPDSSTPVVGSQTGK
jgi:hypothetical protein